MPKKRESSFSCESATYVTFVPDIKHELSYLPVTVHHVDHPAREIQTYALLDNQSNSCFAAETNEAVIVTLTTMLETKKITIHIVKDLVVKTWLSRGMNADIYYDFNASNVHAFKNSCCQRSDSKA